MIDINLYELKKKMRQQFSFLAKKWMTLCSCIIWI